MKRWIQDGVFAGHLALTVHAIAFYSGMGTTTYSGYVWILHYGTLFWPPVAVASLGVVIAWFAGYLAHWSLRLISGMFLLEYAMMSILPSTFSLQAFSYTHRGYSVAAFFFSLRWFLLTRKRNLATLVS